jgi:putative spermidine/putrescine transport system substrate-binding protein
LAGTTQDAQIEHSFAAATGATVVPTEPNVYRKIKAMVEAGAVNWDLIPMEYDYAL